MAVEGKRIVVGVCGGIAAYKAAELVRGLVKAGASVRVAMTDNAARFVAPLTFEGLSGHPVIHRMFDRADSAMAHISWGQEADLIVVAPATANFVAKAAMGLADDFLSTMVLAATAKVLVCPAMNVKMFENPATQHNLSVLAERGIAVLAPGWGWLACGAEGAGRLPDPDRIVEEARMLITEPDLKNRKVLVTAGPTVEPLDPVRHITNRSSGKMGYAIAAAARRRGALVTLVSGPSALPAPDGVSFVPVRTAEQMREAVLAAAADADLAIKAAAVADYRPRSCGKQKIKKAAETVTLELVRTPDILAELGRMRSGRRFALVGFAAETEDLLHHATEKMRAKNLDMIVANDVSSADAGFDVNTNRVKLLFRDGRVEDVPLMAKEAVADRVLDRSKGILDA